MSSQTASYIAYILRLWQEQRNGQSVWRASLESAQSGQRHGFADLHDLFVFLESRIDVSSSIEEATPCEPTINQKSDQSEVK